MLRATPPVKNMDDDEVMSNAHPAAAHGTGCSSDAHRSGCHHCSCVANGFSLLSEQIAALQGSLSTAKPPGSPKVPFTPSKRRGDSVIESIEIDFRRGGRYAAEARRTLANDQEDQIRALQAQLHSAHGQIRELSSNNQELKDRNQKLLDENERFRQVILNRAGTQKVSDQDVIQEFGRLRQAIQKLTTNPAYDFSMEAKLSGEQAAGEDLLQFYSGWGKLSSKDRKFRFRAKVFEILYENILNRRCFGLDGLDGQDKTGTDEIGQNLARRTNLGLIEPGLQQFERFLEDKNVDQEVIADWRIATIECTEKCQHRDRTSERVTELIFNHFQPILSSRAGRDEESTLRSALRDLTKQVYNFAMTTRKSKDRYMFKTLETGSEVETVHLVQANEYWVEPQAVEGGKNNQGSDEIAYAIFGALVKRSGVREYVLEKAHVVLKPKRRSEYVIV